MKRLAWYTAVVLATLTLVILLWELRVAATLFVLSLAISAAVRPIADRLARRRLSHGLVLLLIYLIGLSILGMLVYAISGSLFRELQRLSDDFATAYEHIKQHWPGGSGFQQFIAERLPPADQFYATIASAEGNILAEALMGVTLSVFDILGKLVIVLALSVYWGIDREYFERLWISVLPAEQRPHARSIWRAIDTGVGSYIRSELVQSIMAGVLLGLGYRLMGMPYPTLLAVWGALAWLLPWVGVFLIVIPALLVGLTTSLSLGVLATLYTATLFLLLELVLEPRIFNRRRFSSILILVIAIALADALGMLGLIIAPPLAAAIQIFFSKLLRPPAPIAPVEHVDEIARLKRRLIGVSSMLNSLDQPPPPEVTSMLDRLKHLVDETEQVLPRPSRLRDRNVSSL